LISGLLFLSELLAQDYNDASSRFCLIMLILQEQDRTSAEARLPGSQNLLTVRRWWVAWPSKKFACPIVVDSLVRNWLDAFDNCILADVMLTKLCVDQSRELGSSLQAFGHFWRASL